MRSITLVLAAAALLAAPGATLAAQQRPLTPAQRDSLEVRVRQRTAQVIQRQVGLSDEQMQKLGAVNDRFEGQRRDLLLRERRIRLGLRDEITLGDSTRQAQVAQLLDQMLEVQRQRLALLEAEQKELATFMTPHQRARYFGMEEQLRRRIEEMREQGAPGPGGRRPGMPPGGRPPGGARRPPIE